MSLADGAAPAADLPKDRIRDAATIILIDRDRADGPAVLMGMRGSAAAFMPSKYVFPGGAVDPEDAAAPCPDALSDTCRARLAVEPLSGVGADALARAALREMVEETGLSVSPSADDPLLFVFRAITPPGRPRRFDARFFLIDARNITGDPNDFSAACDELSHLHWVPLAQARELELPFITEVVLAEVAALVARTQGPLAQPETVPFFDNRGDEPRFVQLS
ncbi:NUDIX domain-containing protein [Paracoccus panacisoli]|uniref:NUDIX domain-containing protein n=1 Tax=Paracoccus panacisoli TaxID=1510163 RepID=A0ABV6T579_9RHOB